MATPTTPEPQEEHNNNDEIMTALPKKPPRHVRFQSTPTIASPSLLGKTEDDIELEQPNIITIGSNARSVPHLQAKQSSTPLHGKQSSGNRSFEYMTDDTDDDLDHKHLLPHTQIPQSESREIFEITSKLKKWIGQQEYLILPQFTELMKKIAPHVSTQEASEVFNRIDQSSNGRIATNVLLSNDFLPRMILKYLQQTDNESSDNSDIDSEEKKDDFDEDDGGISTMNFEQLRAEAKRLREWIISIGQPAVERASDLSKELTLFREMYETERSDQQNQNKEKQTIMSHLGALENELNQTRSQSKFLIQERQQLLMKVTESSTQFSSQKEELEMKDKELKRCKNLIKNLRDINDKYLQRMNTVNAEKEKLEEELRKSRELVDQRDNEVSSYEIEIEELNNELRVLKAAADEAENTVEIFSMMNSNNNDIRSIAGGNRTITIERKGLDKSIETAVDGTHSRQNSMLIGNGHVKGNKSIFDPDDVYGTQYFVGSDGNLMALDSINDVADIGGMNDVDDDEVADYDSNGNGSNKQMNVRKGIERTLSNEIVLKKKIRKDLEEEYQLRLHQKDIEIQMQLNRQQQKSENEKRAIIEKYTAMLNDAKSAMMEEANVSAKPNEFVMLDEYGSEFDDEKQNCDKMRKSVNLNEANEDKKISFNCNNSDFLKRIQQLFTESTVLWSLPMIK